METNVEKECSALGALFQHIVGDLKGSTPIWEDFITKATKLQSQLKATVLVSAAFLDSFQKIADMATGARGATKDIGTTLTRFCLRQRSVEAKLKTFASSIMEYLVQPLQEKIEEWKKMTNYLDKEHAKEYKRAIQEIKKKSSDTLRLQKKGRKAGLSDFKRTLDYALQDVSDKYILLEETEKQSLRKALIEERSHFCFFVSYLKPVVESELTMLQEVTHLQEVLVSLTKLTENPHVLPSSSEQVITDLKGSENSWSFQTPPSSPSSLGSRKSSVCSISSLNSSSSGSIKSHSPSQYYSRQWSYSQQATLSAKQLASVSSQDSGFTSQDTLFMCPSYSSPSEMPHQLSSLAEHGSSTLSTPSSPIPLAPCGTATWPNLQDTVQFERTSNSFLKSQRPHTISSAYERAGHARPALTAQTFQPPGSCTAGSTNSMTLVNEESRPSDMIIRPEVPERNNDMAKGKPSVPEKSASIKARHIQNLLERNTPNKSVPDFNRTQPDQVIPYPIYANTSEICGKNAVKKESTPPQTPPKYGNNHKLAHQKDLEAVLSQRLLKQQLELQRHNSDNSMLLRSSGHFKSDRAFIGGSETLPRTKDTACEESIKEWYLYSMAVYNDLSDMNKFTGTQKRPASIAGFGNSPLLHGFRSQTLQRTSSNSSKPPTPVRRTSSISSQRDSASCHNSSIATKNRTDSSNYAVVTRHMGSNDGNLDFKTKNQNTSLLSSDFSTSGNKNSASNDFIGNKPEREKKSFQNDDVEEDVSSSRARLIQALNASFQQQPPKIFGHKSNQNSPRSTPVPKQGSKQDVTNFQSTSRSSSPCLASAQINKEDCTHSIRHEDKEVLVKELSSKISQAKPKSQELKRKPSLPEQTNHRSLSPNSRSYFRMNQQRRASQPVIPLSLSTQVQQLDISDDDDLNEKTLKQCFLQALNAKLSHQKQQQKYQTLSGRIEKGIGQVNNQKKSASFFQQWHRQSSDSVIGTRIQNWPEGCESVEKMCRESLMDQIRRGTTLRKVTSNDRSAPKLS